MLKKYYVPRERGVCMTHDQIAQLFGITRARVQQIEVAALNKIRAHFVQEAIDLGWIEDDDEQEQMPDMRV